MCRKITYGGSDTVWRLLDCWHFNTADFPVQVSPEFRRPRAHEPYTTLKEGEEAHWEVREGTPPLTTALDTVMCCRLYQDNPTTS